MTNHPGTTPRRMSGRLTIKRGIFTTLALTTCAAVALPAGAAQAAPQPQPPVTQKTVTTAAANTAEPANVSAGGTATTAASSSWYNTVRYNRLYKYGGPVGMSRCHEPRNQLNRLDPIKAYHKYFVTCLNNAWSGNIKKAGFKFRVPGVVYYEHTIRTDCGSVTLTAYYCSARGGQIFIPWKQYVGWYKENPLWARTFIAQTIAHEYGHHVQAMSGVLLASWNRQWYLFKTTADKLEENRRRELQATCLGGAYLGADRAYFPMTGSFLSMWKWSVSHMGDAGGATRDHGNYTNNSYWANRGFNYHTSGTCIPWSAPDSRVA